MRFRGKLAKSGVVVLTAASLLTGMFSATELYAQGKEQQEVKKAEVSAKSLNVDVDFFDYNIIQFKGEMAKEKVAINDYAIEQLTSGTAITTDQVFLFGGDRKKGETGPHNVWTGYGKGQYGGIVKDTLDADGNLQFNDDNGVYGVNLFPAEKDSTMDGVIEKYPNANFQFLDNDGTYVFDSDQFAATGLKRDDSGNTVLDMDFAKPGPIFSKKVGSLQNDKGFFPFNEVEGEEHKAKEERHCMFGMKMELNFYMPKDGLVPTKSNPEVKKPMVFEFSGDDDVWVFVDGKLVLDLGGIHDKVSGDINFKTGDVTYYNYNMSGKGCNVKNIFKEAGIDSSAFTEHTLTMFYLERGEYDSNCKISFNIPTLVKTDDIAIKKQVHGIAKEQKDRQYDFVLKYGTDKKKLTETYNGEYTVHNEQDQEVESRTAKDGIIRLKAGETAVVKKGFKGANEYYQVEEMNLDKYYSTEWIATGKTGSETVNGEGTLTEILKRSKESESGGTVIFTNTYHSNNSLTIRKKVDHKMTEYKPGDKFAFTVSCGGIVENFELADGEEKTFSDIPAGTEYIVAEFITGAGITASGSSIYGKPDVTIFTGKSASGSSITGNDEDVREEKAQVSLADSYYRVTGKIGNEWKVDEKTVVEYTNRRGEDEETPTPEVTTTPAVTATPKVTATPAVTETPMATNTPASVRTPAPTKTPTSVTTPPPTNPVVTKVPTTEVPNKTNIPSTKEPEKTQVPKTKEPQKTEVPSTKEPEKTQVPKTEEPQKTNIPETTKIPDSGNSGGTEEPENTPVTITETPIIPNDPVQEDTPAPTEFEVTATAAPTAYVPVELTPPEMPGTAAETDKESDTDSESEESKSGKKDSKDKGGVTTVDESDLPGTLPQTGAFGSFMEKPGRKIVVAFVGIGILAMAVLGYGFYQRKHKKR